MGERRKNIFGNRLFIVLLVSFLLFFLLAVRLFYLQIVHGEEYLANSRVTILRTVPVEAQRGNIYDRYGRPLAENKISYSVKMDLSVPVENLNEVIADFLRVLEEKGGEYPDDFPITKQKPYAFTFGSDSAEKTWKTDMGLKEKQMEFTAEETLRYFRSFFEIPPSYSEMEARRLISVRSKLYLQRYRKYNSVVLAENITSELTAIVEEQKDRFPGLYVEAEAKRYYPEGESLSHVLGYVGSVNEKELAEYEEYGYTAADKIGKLGIEKTCELILNGQEGEKVIEVDALGQRVRETQTKAPQSGGDVFLTIDSRLQKNALKILRNNLKKELLHKMDTGNISLTQVFQSMVDSNALSLDKIMDSLDGLYQRELKELILEENPQYQPEKEEDRKRAKEILKNGIARNQITARQILLCFAEQGKITLDTDQRQRLLSGADSPYAVFQEKLKSDEIAIHEINMDPCTGSAVVLDVHTGEVLALVTYPSYDNNRLVNTFDNEYYKTLLNDPTTPLINRPVMERKAPGSILKMLTAVTGLEEGVIGENTAIQDLGIYKEAGRPYAKCLIYSRYGGTHGLVDVKKAIEVSCNYFFYELAYRLGNAKQGDSLESIEIMNTYMKLFGLDAVSGIEIEESMPKMATPQAKENFMRSVYGDNLKENQAKWMDGDSIRCAIGQSFNSFSAIHMAKYISILANGGTRYQTHLIGGIQKENVRTETPPAAEETLSLKKDTLNIVREGMRRVTKGSQGSLRNFFKEFPIEVGAKTGTAEEADSRPSHSWFAGFAPYENPQIAVVTLVPFGESASGPATKTAMEIIEDYFQLNRIPEKSTEYQNLLMP